MIEKSPRDTGPVSELKVEGTLSVISEVRESLVRSSISKSIDQESKKISEKWEDDRIFSKDSEDLDGRQLKTFKSDLPIPRDLLTDENSSQRAFGPNTQTVS
jgi:hypothetical protein